jgi:hypothetical protein
MRSRIAVAPAAAGRSRRAAPACPDDGHREQATFAFRVR